LKIPYYENVNTNQMIYDLPHKQLNHDKMLNITYETIIFKILYYENVKTNQTLYDLPHKQLPAGALVR
jgi:hypothetical protein